MFDEDTIQTYMAAFDLTRDQAIAALGAAAAVGNIEVGGNDVYFGETRKTEREPTRGYATKKVISVTTDRRTKEDSYGLFWSDESVQNRVLSYLQAIGRPEGGKPAAYNVWKDIVDQAAEIYRGGKGAKISPFELLNMSLQGISAVDVTRQIRMYDEDVLKQVAQAIASKKRGVTLNDQELQEAVDLANSIIERGTVTKTEKVRNPKTGKMETVVKTSPGFSQERFETELGQKIEKETPELVERRKAFEFADILQKALSGGM